MKKLLLILIVLTTIITTNLLGQTEGKSTDSNPQQSNAIPKTDLARFSFTPNIGIGYHLADIPMDGFYAAYGASLKYSFSHVIGLRINGIYGKISGSPITDANKQENAWFTNNTTSISSQFIFNMGGLNFRKGDPKNNFYIGIGGGILLNDAFRDFADPITGVVEKRNTASFVLPFLFGYKRKLSNNFDLGLEWSYYFTADDKIDLYNAGKLPDGYGFGNLTFTYNITTKKRQSHLDWYNPVNKIYKQIEDAKTETIDLAKKDDDGDGIPNFMDKEPNTKSGYKVDNTGVTLDSDNDGIPDTEDADPYGVSQAISKYYPDFNKGNKSDVEIYKFNDSIPQTEFVTISATGVGLPLVTFEPNGYTIHVEQYPLLQQIARIMIADTSTSLVIIGHADNNKEDITQLTLSEKRALEVKRKLAKIYELDESRLLIFSERDPYVKKYKLTTEGLNRKVEFRIIRPKR